MIGKWSVNHDIKKVAYDFDTDVPFLGRFILTRQHVETALRHFDETKRDLTEFNTYLLDGLHMKDIPFGDLPALIDKVEILLADLKELLDKTKQPPLNPPLKQ